MFHAKATCLGTISRRVPIFISLLWMAASVHSGDFPKVFTGTLDGKPGIVIVELGPKMGLAYDKEGAGLWMAWNGWSIPADATSGPGVTSMEPQVPEPQRPSGPANAAKEKPYRSKGPVYHRRIAAMPWSVEKGGVRIPVACKIESHGIVNGNPVLHYSLTLKDGKRISVRENPVFDDHYGANALFRYFHFEGIPKGHSVRLELKGSIARDADGPQKGDPDYEEVGEDFLVQDRNEEAGIKLSWPQVEWGTGTGWK